MLKLSLCVTNFIGSFRVVWSSNWHNFWVKNTYKTHNFVPIIDGQLFWIILERVGKLMSFRFNSMSWELSWNEFKRVQLSWVRTLFDKKELSWVPKISRQKELSWIWVVVYHVNKELSWMLLTHNGIELNWVIE